MIDSIYYDVTQGSDEWRAARLGKITASNLKNIEPLKNGTLPKAGIDYLRNVFASQLHGQDVPPPLFASFNALQWGTDNEPFARKAFEQHTGQTVETVGCYDADGLIISPDGVIDTIDGQIPVEIKCPYSSARHLSNILNNTVPEEYVLQVQAQIIALNAPYAYFVSYDPRLLCTPLHFIKVKACAVTQAKIFAMVNDGYKRILAMHEAFEANRIVASL